MKMKKIALACGAALLGMSAVAQAELSANIGVTSNYMFRGMSLTGDDATVSGGLDYAADSGFYLGTWASSLAGAGTEVDLYAGFGGEIGSAGYDVGVIHYLYPEGGNIDYTELYGSLSFDAFEAGAAYTVQSDSGNANSVFDEGALYFYVGASTDIMDGFSLGATVGYFTWDGVAGADDDYAHVDLSISKSVGDLGDFSFMVSKASDVANPPDGDVNFAVSWGKSF